MASLSLLMWPISVPSVCPFYFSMYGLARFQSVTGRIKGMALRKTFLQQPSFQLFWGKVLLKIGVEICYDFAVLPALGQLSSYSAESWKTMKTIGKQTERKKTANINIQQKIINFIFCLDLLNDTTSYKVVFSSFRIFVLARPCVTFG